LDAGSAHRKVCTYSGQQNTEKRRHTSMPPTRFEPMIPLFERSESVRALDCVVTGMDINNSKEGEYSSHKLISNLLNRSESVLRG